MKDNFVFGVKETAQQLEQKVSMDDEILNFDTRKSTDRRCEFWLEFDNGVKMQAEMIEAVSAPTELIPPVEPIYNQTPKPTKKEVIIRGDPNDADSMHSTQ